MIAPQPSPTTAATRVLVVDDEPQLGRGLTIVLRGAVYLVHVARTASEALAVVAERPPDALLVDLELPDGQGIEVCSEVRRFHEVRILLMPPTGAEREKLHALEAGGDDCLSKPFGGARCLAG
jgi:two-component system KDP operon response regulator KdpE